MGSLPLQRQCCAALAEQQFDHRANFIRGQFREQQRDIAGRHPRQ